MDNRHTEQRAEPRYAADAELTLVIEDPIPAEICGRLVDVSASGFRARLSYPGLEPGRRVRFRHPMREGAARVMWNRILNGSVETGFRVL